MIKRPKQRVIILETRKPESGEKGCLGRTYIPANGDIYRVFINQKQSQSEMFDTLIHELLHVVCGIATFEPALKAVTEEIRVQKAASAVVKILTK